MNQDQHNPTHSDGGRSGRDIFSLGDWAQVCNAHMWWIVTITAAVLVGTAVATFTATQYFSATQRILIEREIDKVLQVTEIYDAASGHNDYYLTQYKLLESRAITVAALARLPQADRVWFHRNGKAVQLFESLRRISPVRKSRLVDIHTEHPDPRVAELMARSIQLAYVDNAQVRHRNANQAAVKHLRDDSRRLRVEMETTQQRSHDYRAEHGIVSIHERQGLAATRLEALADELAVVEREYADSQSRLQTATQAIEKNDFRADLPEVLQNRVVADFKITLMETAVQLSQLSEKYKPKHPRIIEQRGRLLAVEQTLEREIRMVYGALRHENQRLARHKVDITGRIEQQTDKLNLIDGKRIRYQTLADEADATRKLYETVLGRLKEVEVIDDYSTTNVHAVGEAVASERPVRPRKLAAMGIALVAGLLFSMLLSFVLDTMDHSIRSGSEVERLLGLPVLGMLPRVRGRLRHGQTTDQLAMQPNSPIAETFRTIRTSLTLTHPADQLRSIAVTSTAASEGKSLCALNLAVAFARSGQRVLLVDAEMRRPRLHRSLGVEAVEGLSSVLAGERILDEVTFETAEPNLYFVPCGVHPPNPVELLSIGMTVELHQQMLAGYDLLIFDTPPVGVVSDSCILAPLVDLVAFVVRTGRTDRRLCQRAVRSLQSVGGQLAGVILNHADSSAERNRRLESIYDSAYADQPTPSVTIPNFERQQPTPAEPPRNLIFQDHQTATAELHQVASQPGPAQPEQEHQPE